MRKLTYIRVDVPWDKRLDVHKDELQAERI